MTGVTNSDDDENDRSVAILVRFGQFEYLTAGDLGGGDDDRSCTGRTTNQENVESPLAISLTSPAGAGLLTAHGIEVLDVNHHGSQSSTNSQFFNLLTPTVAVINVGDNGHGHPNRRVVDQVLLAQAACVTAPPALVLQTEEGDPTDARTSTDGFCVGDVIIRTTGVGTFQVLASGAVTQGQDERAAAGIGAAGRAFPLDGATAPPATDLVITEIMQNPDFVSDTRGEWFEIHNPGTAAVDINGWTIRDEGSDLHVIANGGPLLVPGGGSIVLGRNGDPAQNGCYTANYVYTGMNLANGDDEILLIDLTGRTVDRVAYTGSAPWPDPTGRSMQLQNLAGDNNDGSNWAEATTRGGSFSGAGTDLGFPGS